MGGARNSTRCRSCGYELPDVSSELLTVFCPSCLGKKRQAEAAQRDRSIQWFRQLAEQGDGRAQYCLGRMYASGDNRPKDEIHAYAWLHLAAMNGHREAMVKREVVAQRLIPDQISQAKCLARTWEKKHREEDDHV